MADLPRSWPEFRAVLSEYSGVIALVLWAITVVSWITGIVPHAFVFVFAGFAAAFSLIGIVGYVFVSGGDVPTQLGPLVPEVRSESARRTVRARSNLSLLGVDYINLYIDDHGTFWEIQRGGMDTQFYSVVLRLENVTSLGAPGRELNDLRARITFHTLSGRALAPVDRAPWIREEYNAIDLPVGDHRGLVVAHGVPPGMMPPPGDETYAYSVANNHYSPQRYYEPVFGRLDEAAYLVDVRIISGDAGTVRFERTFRLQTRPHLLLLEEN